MNIIRYNVQNGVVFIYVRVRACLHAIGIRAFACALVRLCDCLCMCVLVRVCVHTCERVCARVHTHVQRGRSSAVAGPLRGWRTTASARTAQHCAPPTAARGRWSCCWGERQPTGTRGTEFNVLQAYVGHTNGITTAHVFEPVSRSQIGSLQNCCLCHRHADQANS